MAINNLSDSESTREDAGEKGYTPSTAFSLKTSSASACIKVRIRNTHRCLAELHNRFKIATNSEGFSASAKAGVLEQ